MEEFGESPRRSQALREIPQGALNTPVHTNGDLHKEHAPGRLVGRKVDGVVGQAVAAEVIVQATVHAVADDAIGHGEPLRRQRRRNLAGAQEFFFSL